jgi:hypothetical protein
MGEEEVEGVSKIHSLTDDDNVTRYYVDLDLKSVPIPHVGIFVFLSITFQAIQLLMQMPMKKLSISSK